MYKVISQEEALKNRKYDGYKLCYIDEIPTTYTDYTPEAKAYRETEEWKEQDRLRSEKLHTQGYLSGDDPEFSLYRNPILKKGSELEDYPNPDYIKGKQVYYAYFTPISLEEQWGDDWDDCPYEYNAGTPYDSLYEEKDENGNWKEYEIIQVPFFINRHTWRPVKFPEDYGCYGNSPWCVRDINAGAIAWIYYPGDDRKTSNGSIVIPAGTNPHTFIEKIEKLNELVPYEEEEDDD